MRTPVMVREMVLILLAVGLSGALHILYPLWADARDGPIPRVTSLEEFGGATANAERVVEDDSFAKESGRNFGFAPQYRIAQVMGASDESSSTMFDPPEKPERSLADPIEPWNRGVFWFNDKVYFYGLKPLTQGYRTVTTAGMRRSVGRAFRNLQEPTFTINALLQGEGVEAAESFTRFILNTTVGMGGFFNPAGKYVDPVERRFDETFFRWGIDPGFYVIWPFVGPSSVRGTGAYVAGIFTDPPTYVRGPYEEEIVYGSRLWETVNETSFRLGQYEDLKRYALDPYIAQKHVYEQFTNYADKRPPSGPPAGPVENPARFVFSVRAGRTTQPDGFRFLGAAWELYYDRSPLYPGAVEAGYRWLNRNLGTNFSNRTVDWGLQFGLTKYGDKKITDQLEYSLVPKFEYDGFPVVPIFIQGGVGASFSKLKDENTEDLDLELGSDLLFATDLVLGVRLRFKGVTGSIGYEFAHRSNADLAKSNLGINAHLLRLSMIW